MLIAQGKPGGPINCRYEVFSAEMRAEAIERGHGAHARKLGEAAITWATKALMQGLSSAKAELADPSRP